MTYPLPREAKSLKESIIQLLGLENLEGSGMLSKLQLQSEFAGMLPQPATTIDTSFVIHSHDIFPSFMFILLGMFGYVWLAQGSGTKQSQRHHVVLDLVGPGGLDPRLGGCGHQSIPLPRPLGGGGVGPGSQVWAIGFAAERQLQLDITGLEMETAQRFCMIWMVFSHFWTKGATIFGGMG